MSADFIRPLAHIDMLKVKDVEPEKVVRLYCAQSGQAWQLQLRAPITLANHHAGKDFIVASAQLGLDDLKALRDAIDEKIQEASR